MFRASIFESPLDEQLYSTVMWHQGDKFFGVFAHSQVPGRALSWDSYGRSLTGGRDLAGFVAQVDGDRVSVIAADSPEVAGDPLPVSPTSPGPRPEPDRKSAVSGKSGSGRVQHVGRGI